MGFNHPRLASSRFLDILSRSGHKKRPYWVIVAAVVVLTLGACAFGDIFNPGLPYYPHREDVVGVWSGTCQSVGGATDSGGVFTFFPDGTLTFENVPEAALIFEPRDHFRVSGSGNWEFDGAGTPVGPAAEATSFVVFGLRYSGGDATYGYGGQVRTGMRADRLDGTTHLLLANCTYAKSAGVPSGLSRATAPSTGSS
jgi:hypothetical protein